MKNFTYLIAFLFLALYNPLTAQTDSLYITPVTTIIGNQVRVDFPVKKFDEVVCLQYTMNYDASVLEFDFIDNMNLPDLNSTGNFNPANPGKIAFSWVDITTLGISKNDGESIYSIFFNIVGNGGVTDLYIDGSMIIVEACVATVPLSVVPLLFETITIAAFVTTTSNNDITLQSKVDVFPNPSSDQVTFQIDGIQENLQLEVYDATGKQIKMSTIQNQQFILSKQTIGTGLYFYKLYSNDKVINTGKFTFF